MPNFLLDYYCVKLIRYFLLISSLYFSLKFYKHLSSPPSMKALLIFSLFGKREILYYWIRWEYIHLLCRDIVGFLYNIYIKYISRIINRYICLSPASCGQRRKQTWLGRNPFPFSNPREASSMWGLFLFSLTYYVCLSVCLMHTD